jgi:transposase
VADYERIRRSVVIEELSRRETARLLHHSRKTVAKALAHSVPPGYRREAPYPCPVLEPYQAVIDGWLEEDRKRPRKQRHTAWRVWERLRDERGFTGSVRTVRRYVRKWREKGQEVFFPLVFDPGEECQVDWGRGWAVIGGQEREICLFCMRQCYSTGSFARAYEREVQEGLQDGHERGFGFFQGVPRRLAYDNLGAVVKEVGPGRQRELTEWFLGLKSHYLFETRFCNVGQGHEKGHVENLVKHVQRTFLTPLPEVASLEELNAHLEQACRKDLDRRARDGKTRRQLLAEEQERFLPLPAAPLPACRQATPFASKMSLVRFENNDYSVPVRWARHPCLVQGYLDRVAISVRGEVVAEHKRLWGEGGYALNWRHYVPLLERKPGGLFNGRAFRGDPWGEDFARMRRELEYRYDGDGTRKFVKLLLLCREFPVPAVQAAVAECVRRRAFSEEAVRSVLTGEPRREAPAALDLAGRPTLAGVSGGVREAQCYDALLGREVLV